MTTNPQYGTTNTISSFENNQPSPIHQQTSRLVENTLKQINQHQQQLIQKSVGHVLSPQPVMQNSGEFNQQNFQSQQIQQQQQVSSQFIQHSQEQNQSKDQLMYQQQQHTMQQQNRPYVDVMQQHP